MIIREIIFLLSASFFSCINNQKGSKSVLPQDLVNPNGKTIVTRFNVPEGFVRVQIDSNTFESYLRNLPLKSTGSKVHNYDGSLKTNEGVYCAVVDIDVGMKDLQQCADAVMRLRAEYLFSQKRYDLIHFNFTSGDNCEWAKYAEGFRPIISGNNVRWNKTSAENYSHENFRKYLDLVFTYAGSLSLSRELESVNDWNEILIGDVIIVGGSPGHAVIVVDIALNEQGEKLFMLAQSYMPAQDIQILVNPDNESISPWYSVNFGEELETPEWTFSRSHLMRFAD